MVIHKGQCVQANLSDSMLSFIKLAGTSKEYMTKSKFHMYEICFVKYLESIGCFDENHLMIIDSHKSHMYNLTLFDEMRENDIHVTAIPPHASHILQPPNSTFVQFKCNWQSELLDLNFAHNAKVLTKCHF